MRCKSFGLFLLLSTIGCSTAKTTFMSVDSNGNFTENPDHCVHGVPAVVKVPTHIEVKINQSDIWRIEQLGSSPKKLIHVPSATLRSVEITEISINKMIMVDPKRPISGMGEFVIKYDEKGEGVIDTLNYKAVDETIKNSAALATAALKAFGVKTSTDANLTALGDSAKIVKVDRAIAIRRFPIHCSQPEIEDFVGQYINLCTPANCQSPTGYAK